MGPNGSGKSTLAYVLGRTTTKSLRAMCCSMAKSILEMAPDERAAKGVFLAFQYPWKYPV
jgi:Fe-S cluster assembly ATP-binding protein